MPVHLTIRWRAAAAYLVQRWRRMQGRRSVLSPEPGWRPPSALAYCQLLGVYLGDGWITRIGRSATLCASLDKSHPGVVNETVSAIVDTFPGTPVHRYAHRPGCVILKMSHPDLPFAFPQHGLGRKHERQIDLVPWQRDLTRAYPEQLLRGMIHSDGCRCVNRFETRLPSGRVAQYEYPRYFFTNLSSRHQTDLLRALRAVRHPLHTVEPSEHLRLAPQERRAPRQLYRAQALNYLN